MLPGEDLLDAVHRTVAAAGIGLDHIAGYLGHHDLPIDAGLVRTFVFAGTLRSGRACHPTVFAPYRWADIEDLPDNLDVDVLAFIHAPRITADDPDQVQWLSAGLHSHARGLPAAEAAVELLVGHRLWLRRTDFVDDCIDLRVRPVLCLPADSLLPGHIPAHEARWPASGNRDMSTPISARMTSAVRRWTPGMVHSSSTCRSKGAITRSILSPSVSMVASA